MNTGNPATAGRTWEPVQPLISPGLDVGGDIQAGDGWDIRFWRDDQPKAVATVWIYPVRYEDRPGYRVQVQTELTICADRADPGGTEEWADAFYRDEPGAHHSLRQAENAARELAERYAAGLVHVTAWDGTALSVPESDRRRAAALADPGEIDVGPRFPALRRAGQDTRRAGTVTEG